MSNDGNGRSHARHSTLSERINWQDGYQSTLHPPCRSRPAAAADSRWSEGTFNGKFAAAMSDK
jgi:hypothetical protein